MNDRDRDDEQQRREADHRRTAPPRERPADQAREPRRWASWNRQEARK